MEKLKPCPFCGASGISVHLSREKGANDTEWQYQVVCNYNLMGCGASGCYNTDPKEAIKAWNRRMTDEHCNKRHEDA